MVFSSLTFLLIYLPIVCIVHKCTPSTYRNFILFLFNMIFYGWGEPVFIFIMLIIILYDYYEGIQIYKYLNTDRKKAKRHLIYSIVFSMSFLFFFKYFDFFILSINTITSLQLPTLGIVLPIGISFYTFQTMSYTIDVYRGDVSAQKKFFPFATYVSLFPQLIAGPIVRYRDVEKDLVHRNISVEDVSYGIERFIIGLSKKVLLANNIAILNQNIMAQTDLTTLGTWIAMIAFAFQIYFDFSGYSDMAIGLGRMFGFHFLENFNYPYISKSITEFWQRWHISLSTWFKEYVYIPLGGNRCGKKRMIVNIFIVWGLTGFWHGASFNFLLWGLYFGCVLLIEKLWLSKILKRLPVCFQHTYALFIILISWAIFAIEDVSILLSQLQVMLFMKGDLYSSFVVYESINYIGMLMICVIACTPFPKLLYQRIIKHPSIFALKPIMISIMFLLCISYLVSGSYNPFLYFRF